MVEAKSAAPVVVFGSHAIDRMNQRSITGSEVRHILENPEGIEPYKTGYRLSGAVNGRRLVVGVFINRELRRVDVATVFDKDAHQ